MAKQRDYRAEYNRRLERAKRLGYSRSVARGHAPSDVYSITEAAKASSQSHHRVVAGQSKYHATGKGIDETTFQRGIEEAVRFGVNERKIRNLDIHDEESFIKMLLDLGLTPKEAYTLRFSP